MVSGKNFIQAVKNYWKIFFLIIYPLILLPIIFVENKTANRCIYVITLMGGFWLLEILPIAITSLMPVAVFPILGILPTKTTSKCYITEPTALFVGSYLLGLAVQECTLHRRITYNILKLVGFSPKKLHIILTCATLFLSIFVSSITSTALMIPIVRVTLTELQELGICKIYKSGSFEEDEEDIYEDKRRPTKFAMGFLVSIAYASIIGNTGYFTGDTSNVDFIKTYESTTPEKMNSGVWLVFSVPYIILTIILTILWMQIFYMGLFRPNSSESQEIRIIPDDEIEQANTNIVGKLQAMGRMSFHEVSVAVCVVLAILLWFFREPVFMPGWIFHLPIQPATVAIGIIIILFYVPRLPVCCNVFSSNEEKIPIENSPGLLLWKFVVRKVPWVLVFLIGGADAVAEGAKKSKLSDDITNGLKIFKSYSTMGACSLVFLISIAMTQFTYNAAVSRTVMPALAEISEETNVHPIYTMLPTFFSISFGYLFPVSSPPIAMIADLIHMTTLEIVKIGIVVLIISYLVLMFVSFIVLSTINF
ncbi:hypothetical protein WA026_020306 [Henosepilachna vigintioctopunctata]|uniref:Uncharacterized protein n=1 Tax=Henosepilachna vigintioctopunctata TaxID=420089 RepID=A0AAW1TXX5_9CUCU